MASQITLVSVDEYLHSVYEPDVDYVDGVLEDRNVGEKKHGLAINPRIEIQLADIVEN